MTYGTSLKLVGVQVKTVNTAAGVDTGDMSPENVAELFGKGEGFKVSDPNVQAHKDEDLVEDDDYDLKFANAALYYKELEHQRKLGIIYSQM